MTLEEAYEKVLDGKTREQWIEDAIAMSMKLDPTLWRSVASFRAECDLETLARCMVEANSDKPKPKAIKQMEIVKTICDVAKKIHEQTKRESDSAEMVVMVNEDEALVVKKE